MKLPEKNQALGTDNYDYLYFESNFSVPGDVGILDTPFLHVSENRVFDMFFVFFLVFDGFCRKWLDSPRLLTSPKCRKVCFHGYKYLDILLVDFKKTIIFSDFLKKALFSASFIFWRYVITYL